MSWQRVRKWRRFYASSKQEKKVELDRAKLKTGGTIKKLGVVFLPPWEKGEVHQTMEGTNPKGKRNMTKLKKRRIGIFGGSFDPIHVGHLMLAQAALELYELERVFFLPARPSPSKCHRAMTEAGTRFRMVEIATEDNPRFEVSNLELDQPESSYTIDTIRILKKQYPGAEIYFIAGADIIMQIEAWMTFEELLREVIFLAAYRPSHSRAQLESQVQQLNLHYGGDIRLMEFPSIHLSSSYIREIIMRGGSARYLVPDCVLQYIKDKGIYFKT